MIQKNGKRSLFGGTLRAAGLAGASICSMNATADFNSEQHDLPNITFAYAVDAADDTVLYVYDQNYEGQFPLTTSYDGSQASISSYLGPTLLGVSITAGEFTDWVQAGTSAYQYFTVDSAKSALLEWDLEMGGAYSSVGISEVNGDVLASFSEGSSGALLLAFEPSTLYFFFAKATLAEPDVGASAFARLTWVPAPGAVAMLCVGGVIGARRRRRG